MNNINPYILLVISMAACLGCTIIRKYYSDKFSGKALSRYFYNAVTALVSAIALTIMAICFYGVSSILSVSLFTLILAVAFGIITAVQQIMVLKAFENGPFAYTTVITSLSMLIPTLSGVLIFRDETIKPLQYVGIALMVVCLILSVKTTGDKSERKASFKWLSLCAVAFVCTGLIGVMQKWHQSSDSKGELNAFLIIAFIIAFVYSAIMSLILLKKEPECEQTGKKALPFLALIPIVLTIVAGACVAVNNMFNLYLTGVLPAAEFFPLVNGGGLILATLSGLVLFREKLSLRQWIGIGFGIVAVFMLCI